MSLEVLKYSGFLLMILDHLNRYLLSGAHEWMEQAGRAVFPLFALVLGVGLRGEGCERRAVRVLCSLAVLSVLAHLAAMPLVAAGVRGEALNVLVTLACGVVLVRFGVWFHAEGPFRRVEPLGWAVVVSVALAVSMVSEFGMVGALLVYAVWRGHAVAVWGLLALLSVSQLTVVPLFVPLMYYVAEWLANGERWRSPRMLFGMGYVVQFAAFSLFVIWQ